MITLLDGPMGSELEARGVSTALPRWSATALDDAPQVVAAIHTAYANAGATVHTTNTFRTRLGTVGPRWEVLARRAVALAREAVPESHRVAGSVAPLFDCYRPDLSRGAASESEHRALAEVLVDAGCDLLLCETHCDVDEYLAAVDACVVHGVPVWAALTAGPDADLMTPDVMAEAARVAVDRGAECVLVNCTPASASLAYVEALARVAPRVGVYANAGRADDDVGWCSDATLSTRAYAQWARAWIDAGACVVGGCCGVRPAHIAALPRR